MNLNNAIIAGSYEFPDISIDCQSTVNLFVGINEAEQRKYIKQTPGLKLFIEAKAEVRGMFVDVNEDLYVVEGEELVRYREEEDFENNNKIVLNRYVVGRLQTKTGGVNFAENGFQLALVDGKNLYLYIYEDDTFKQYKPEGWLGSNVVEYDKGFFIFVEPNTQKYYISKLYDGTNIDAFDFASAEDDPDPIVTAKSAGSLLYMFGTRSLEIMNNTGDADFPYSPASGGAASIGCLSEKSVQLINNQIFWLGRDKVGFGIIYTTPAGSLNPTRISNFAVESFLQQQEKITDATSYVYQEDGHNFYCINFLNAKTTFCYDLNTGSWHERRHLNKNGEETRSVVEDCVLFNNKHIVSDYRNNLIYQQSQDFLDENGEPIKRFRRSSQMKAEDLSRMFFKSFKLDLSVNKKEIEDPKIYLRYSDDNGFSWTDYIEEDLENIVEWRLLGSSISGRVWEISWTDAVSITLNNAYIK